MGFVLGPSIVKQLIAGSSQHLCYDVLIDVSQIGAELVIQQLLIDDVLGVVFVPECKGNEQTRVSTEYLELGNILGQRPEGGRRAFV